VSSKQAPSEPLIPHAPAADAKGQSWHVAIYGQKHGPMDREAILSMMREGKVPLDSLVWTSGMAQWQPAIRFPDFAAAMGVLSRASPNAPADGADEAMSAIVPFSNPPALIAYYLAIASLIPVAGAILGPLAIRFGVRGLRFRREHRVARGGAHARTAIILGSIVSLVHLALVAFLILWAAGVVTFNPLI
jgi:hypothetical protein